MSCQRLDPYYLKIHAVHIIQGSYFLRNMIFAAICTTNPAFVRILLCLFKHKRNLLKHMMQTI